MPLPRKVAQVTLTGGAGLDKMKLSSDQPPNIAWTTLFGHGAGIS